MDEERRRRADSGEQDEMAQLVELAGEAGDTEELRGLAEAGSSDPVDVLDELAGEREDLEELRRLAALGDSDATVLRVVRRSAADGRRHASPSTARS